MRILSMNFLYLKSSVETLAFSGTRPAVAVVRSERRNTTGELKQTHITKLQLHDFRITSENRTFVTLKGNRAR